MKAIAALLLLCPACMLTPEGERVPDWNTWDAELEDVQADIDAILPLYPEHADTLLELRGHAENAEQVVEALAEGTGEFEGSDAVAYIRAGLVTAEALVPIFLEDDPERAERVRFYIAVFRIVLRRVERYALE
ncbi:MAG: hypothetical protein GY820_48520 [Gammaproteobacteria bacterium]|nr:hypothetical protein [Gammaproteobacteria bacterium]